VQSEIRQRDCFPMLSQGYLRQLCTTRNYRNIRVMHSTSTFASPKRKRDCDDTESAPSPTKIRTELPSRPSRPVEKALADNDSPRAAVASKFSELDLRQVNDGLQFAQPDSPTTRVMPYRMINVTGSSMSSSDDMAIFTSGRGYQVGSQDLEIPETPQVCISAPTLSEPPRTPTLKPSSSPQGVPRTISPIQTPRARLVEGSSLVPLAGTPPRLKSPRLSDASPMQGITIGGVDISELVWSDSEITGHDPDDPTDDGYGINGIGFRPTPAMAQARANRRKQQVAEWKSREAREARQKRSERRRNDTALTAQIESGNMNDNDGPRRVRFAVEG
jgi:hypothetical protein